MKDERFHLNYVEQELERQQKGANGEFLATAIELARQRFDAFQQARQQEVRAAMERLLG